MSFADFTKVFTSVDVCHFVNTSFFSVKKTWTETILNGEWTMGSLRTSKDRSGGNSQNDSFLRNPQVKGTDYLYLLVQRERDNKSQGHH